jgi:transcriptional regulator with PAS, ATPase and Fis domain
MKTILISWIGVADLKAASDDKLIGPGPIKRAIDTLNFDEIVLLSDQTDQKNNAYKKWLGEKTSSPITLHQVELSSPVNFGEIYEASIRSIKNTKKRHDNDVNLTYYLSPGTPAMAAVWIIIAKTRFPATLIESSTEAGVKTASIPFDISAEFIPDLLRKPDERLEQLAVGLPQEAPEFASLIQRSKEMKRVIAKARHIAPRSIPVLIEGESGTGKELLARAIHEASPRKGKPFISVNCGAIPAELLESEFFGYEKGAFTGADKQKEGFFEAADAGTLFLDEIGELPLAAQVKLLRVLQEREIIRLGSTQTIKFDVRIIVATNRNLIEAVTEEKFRSDLFYRIAVAVLKLPPLRERSGDIGLLIDRLLDQINSEGQDQPGYKHKKLSAKAKNLMFQHHWPGNIRELHNTLQRAAIWSPGTTITVEDIQEAMLPMINSNNDELLNKTLSDGINLPKLLEKLAQHYLVRAMDEAHGNKTKAAELLGLPSYQTLSNWMKKYRVR